MEKSQVQENMCIMISFNKEIYACVCICVHIYIGFYLNKIDVGVGGG